MDWRAFLPATVSTRGVGPAEGCPDSRWFEFLQAMGTKLPVPAAELSLEDLNDPESLALGERLGAELAVALYHRAWILDRPAPQRLDAHDLNSWLPGAFRHASPGKLYMSATATAASFEQRGAEAFDLPLVTGPGGLRLGLARGAAGRATNVRPGTAAVLVVGHLGVGELIGELRGGRLVLRVVPGGTCLFGFLAVPVRGSSLFPHPRKVAVLQGRLARVQQRAGTAAR